MDQTEVERQAIQVDDLVRWVPFWPVHLVDARQVRPAFHFDVGVAFPVEDVHVACILQESTLDGDGFLIVQHRPIDQIINHIGGCEAI